MGRDLDICLAEYNAEYTQMLPPPSPPGYISQHGNDDGAVLVLKHRHIRHRQMAEKYLHILWKIFHGLNPAEPRWVGRCSSCLAWAESKVRPSTSTNNTPGHSTPRQIATSRSGVWGWGEIQHPFKWHRTAPDVSNWLTLINNSSRLSFRRHGKYFPFTSWLQKFISLYYMRSGTITNRLELNWKIKWYDREMDYYKSEVNFT